MELETKSCPHCGSALKSGVFTNISLLSTNKTLVINDYFQKSEKGYCTKCGLDLWSKAVSELSTQKSDLVNKVQDLLYYIPVISMPSPLGWDYQVIGMVTGQSTTGTGVISEFTSSFTDLVGGQSGRYNQKLKMGEYLCFSQLRKQTLDWGGNAVLSTDIDYSEVGGEKGMLMVCMAGTAVRLNNPHVLGEERAQKIEQLQMLGSHLSRINSYNLNE